MEYSMDPALEQSEIGLGVVDMNISSRILPERVIDLARIIHKGGILSEATRVIVASKG